MKITDNLIVEAHDLEGLLTQFLRSYRHYNHGKMPGKIILPVMKEITFRQEMMPPKFATIPIEFEKETTHVTSGHSGTSRDGNTTEASSTSNSNKSKQDKKG